MIKYKCEFCCVRSGSGLQGLDPDPDFFSRIRTQVKPDPLHFCSNRTANLRMQATFHTSQSLQINNNNIRNVKKPGKLRIKIAFLPVL